MSFNIGLNFRGTLGGASDPTDCVFVSDSTVSAYPNVNGIAGWTSGIVGSSDRSGATDPRLKGIIDNSTSGNPVAIFRVDLPTPITLELFMAIGDGEGGLNSPDMQIEFYDNLALRYTFGPRDLSILGANNYFDSVGGAASEAAWVAFSTHGGTTSGPLTFNNGVMFMNFISGSGFWGAAHIFIAEVVTQTTLPFFTQIGAQRF